ncbi:MAG: SIMPL domain-containing protein [Patescibacteria group bacterium]|nr:SIMPL domain-containing protein [Patescibacteria group bacterium]MDE2116494.1 SIMPL domain-containing protein [Patescibacteria group bacterium]
MQNLTNQPAFKNLVIALLGLLVALAAVGVIAGLKSLQFIGAAATQTDTITVTGTGDVYAIPDIATFDFTVTTEAANVADAQKSSSDKTDAILAYLQKNGVADTDVQTTSYDIYPRYEYHTTMMQATGAPNASGAAGVMIPVYNQGTQVLAGYDVSETVEVKVRKLADAGTILGGIGSLGATNISGLTFSVDQETALEHQARDKAIADAKTQAQSLAASLGVTLGRIESFSESGNQPQPIYFARAMSAAASGASTPQVPAGQNKITSTVQVTYQIQ